MYDVSLSLSPVYNLTHQVVRWSRFCPAKLIMTSSFYVVYQILWLSWRGGAHWALEHTEVILKFQTWRYQLCFRVSVLDLGLWLLILHFGKFLSYKCSPSFFKEVRILPEIDWYHYQDTSTALCIVKTSMRWSVTLEPSVWGAELCCSFEWTYNGVMIGMGWGVSDRYVQQFM